MARQTPELPGKGSLKPPARVTRGPAGEAKTKGASGQRRLRLRAPPPPRSPAAGGGPAAPELVAPRPAPVVVLPSPFTKPLTPPAGRNDSCRSSGSIPAAQPGARLPRFAFI